MNETQTHPGSRWHKFDFHTHTPASKDYGRGDPSFKDISEDVWLQSVMQKELDCVVVTDHNSGGWIDQLKTRYNQLKNGEDAQPSWFRKLTIFPGVEITVAESSRRVHLLAIFDPEFGTEKVTSVLGACGINEGFGDEESTSTTGGFLDAVTKVQHAGGIALPAHIDGRKGLLEGNTTLTPELEKSLKAVSAAEFCDLQSFSGEKVDLNLRKAVGKLAKVAGSDAHVPGDLGKHFSWVKMGTPTIEGLQLALMDQEYCVRNQDDNPNTLPNIYISGLEIQNMRHCGRVQRKPLEIEFHPHFNTIIGGRGAGKSTLIHSIRIASRRDQGLEHEAPGVKEELDKFMAPARNKSGVMLDSTKISLFLYRFGEHYILNWKYDGSGAVLEQLGQSDWEVVDEGNLLERFPLSIYSQKQINELASNPRGLMGIVDRSDAVNYSEWKSRWDSTQSSFLQLRERQRELHRQLSGEVDLKVQLKDVQEALKKYEDQGHGEVLQKFQKRSQQKNGMPGDLVFDSLHHTINQLAESVGFPDFPGHLFEQDDATVAELQTIHQEATASLDNVKSRLLEMAQEVLVIKASRNSALSQSQWHQDFLTSNEKYTELVKEYESRQSPLNLSTYGEWVQKRNQLQQRLQGFAAIRQELKQTKEQVSNELSKLENLRDELFEKRKAFLEGVIGNNPYVRMEIIPFGDTSTLVENYRTILGLGDTSFGSSIYDSESQTGLLNDLVNWETNNVPESQLPTLIREIKDKTWKIATGTDEGFHGHFNNRLKSGLDNKPSDFDQLYCWWPEDLIRVRYVVDASRNKTEDLDKGSAGQKAAAILAFLLSHGDEPLIIDQPEDDLDNALIYDLVVKQILENKSRRQIIIVTHNPNIVVNGDSELLNVLEFKGGQVQRSILGGLEEPKIRKAVCDIMEGGRTAFEKRYKRIAIDGVAHV